MSALASLIQTADWKKEKHSPVVEAPEAVKAGEAFKVAFGIGKEIAHPNTAEHHITYITLFFQPEGNKFPYQVAHVEFSAHGEVETFTDPWAKVMVKVNSAGTFIALAHCNIHGLWEGTKEVKLEA
ncbi:MAG: hypothetical protein HPY85_11840 [Anaerolineae bacterium]|nr:hypothetical protein [Anaerolineae bacterium]